MLRIVNGSSCLSGLQSSELLSEESIHVRTVFLQISETDVLTFVASDFG